MLRLGRIARVSMAGIATLLCLAGCDLGPDYERPALEIPAAYRATDTGADVAAGVAEDWWRGFGSADLSALIDEAGRQNFDLLAAIARVQQADAQVRIAGAALLPSLNATGKATWTKESAFSAGIGGRHSDSLVDLHDYTAGLNAAYAVDFWGKALSSRRSAAASAVFSRFDQQTVALTVATSVAATWFNALGDADELAVASRTSPHTERTLEVIRGRLEAGTASALDEAQEEALVAGVRATIPNLRSQMEQQIIGLGILIGHPPEAVTVRPGTLEQPHLARRRGRACRPPSSRAVRTWPAPKRSSSRRIST